LRDWLFSRQRYWGEPFPVIWENGRHRALAASKLPVLLPELADFKPTGTAEPPLAKAADWVRYSATATRELNTMPQWAGSCWYYLRYLDTQNDTALASPAALDYWKGPDIYVGGAEHAVLHLLYARFWHKVLYDLGVVPTLEPFTRLFHQGIILGEDGEKMSKSRGNVANPDDIIRSHGTDTLRLYLMFLGPLEAMKPWNPNGIEGVHRFLQKIWRECVERDTGRPNPKLSDAADATSPELAKLLHETIKKVGDDIIGLRYNTAISAMMIFSNAWQKAERIARRDVLSFLQILAPLAPHIAEELWARLGGSEIAPTAGQAPWPAYDPAKLVASEVKIIIQINGKRRGELLLPVGASEAAVLAAAQANPEAIPHLAGKELKRVIYVPGKILNIVVA
jgi:leucyl-tRNA synthetase